jgi:hypothetical protein
VKPLLLALVLIGCGGDGGGNVINLTGPLLPWAVGNTWTYRVTDKGKVDTKVVTVGAAEPIGAGPNSAMMANKVLTMTGNDKSISWQGELEGAVVRYREQSFKASTGALSEDTVWVPHRLHVDSTAAHTVTGASWLDMFDETKTPADTTMPPKLSTGRERWSVMSDHETITVPAGTFVTVMLQRISASSTKTYWFAHGVGKIKETGGQTEELVKYQVQ